MKKNVLIRLVLLFTAMSLFSQTKEEIAEITKDYDKAKLSQMAIDFSARFKKEKEEALRLAKINNWPLTIEKDSTFSELMKVVDGKPMYYTTYNVNAAVSTRTNFLHNNGLLGLNLEGQNMTAHIWDSGLARTTHQEYDGVGGNNRFSIGDGSTELHYHSAHVTGTIIASGLDPQAKGMAPQASAIGFDWDDDLSEATNYASQGMLVSNHSYGWKSENLANWKFGAYTQLSRDWDNLMYHSPYYLLVTATGNEGNNSTDNGNPLEGNSNYDKLTAKFQTSKNSLVVANAQDAIIDANGNLVSVSINSGGSQGPTDDYRIKPDITGNGTLLYSTYQNANDAYASISGTSMASPNVAGSLLLLQQHYNNLNSNFMRASTLKGLALHTADDAGQPGPDAIFGWGLLNAKEAAKTITNKGSESIIVEPLINPFGDTYQITVESDGINPLIASISWTDFQGPANTGTANDTTPVLVNDLDIRVTKGGTTYYPYKLTSVTTNGFGDNTVDPFERISIPNASGTYTITVSHKGLIANVSQRFSLIVTGKKPTGFCNSPSIPTNLHTTTVTHNEASFVWDDVTNAHYELIYQDTNFPGWISVITSENYTVLTGLNPNTPYEAKIRSFCPDDNTYSDYSNPVFFITTDISNCIRCDSYGEANYNQSITLVNFNTINNPSGKPSGYSDYTAIATEVQLNNQYDITVNINTAGNNFLRTRVWIDWNQDCDFTDIGEDYYLGFNINDQDDPTSNSPFSITVPSDAALGNTVMRVSTKYNVNPESCSTDFYGEVEDYTLTVVTCPTAQPYLESFEDFLDLNICWVSDDYDNLVWDINSGSTPSTGTGPSAAHSGNDYVYVESTGSNNGDVAVLLSPNYDISG